MTNIRVPRRKYTPEEIWDKFWPRVDATGDCWIWTGSIREGGYGDMYIGPPKTGLVHRLSYEFTGEKIPPGWQVDHRCFVRACVNPAHLEVVTAAVNTYRSGAPSAMNRRKTMCKRGHELSGENLTLLVNKKNGNLRRECRACRLAGARRRYAAAGLRRAA